MGGSGLALSEGLYAVGSGAEMRKRGRGRKREGKGGRKGEEEREGGNQISNRKMLLKALEKQELHAQIVDRNR